MSDLDLPSVLVVGGVGVGKRHVAGRIRGEAIPADVDVAEWEFETKYYEAKALIRVSQALTAIPPAEPEAVVLVFDRGRESTFREVAEVWETIATSEDTVRVLVGNDAVGRGEEAVVWADDVDQWCCANLVEYIELPHGAEEDDEGAQRLIEALHAHRWPGMIMRDRRAERQRAAAWPGKEPVSADVPLDGLLAGGPLGAQDDNDELAMAFEQAAGMRRQVLAARPEERAGIAARQMERLLAMLGIPDDGESEDGGESDESEGGDRSGVTPSAATRPASS